MMNEKLDQLDGSFDDPNTMVAKKYFHAQLHRAIGRKLQVEFLVEIILYSFIKLIAKNRNSNN